MAWASSNLAGSVRSAYTQYDNLRSDLVTGKFWATAGTYYTQISHDGTDGTIQAYGGKIQLKSTSGIYRMWGDSGTAVLDIRMSGAVTSGNCTVRIFQSGASSKFMFQPYGGINGLEINDGTGNAVSLVTCGNYMYITGSASLDGPRIGPGGTATSQLGMMDGTGTWRVVIINSGGTLQVI